MGTIVVVCFAVGLVSAVWFVIDASRIPSIIWYWSGYSRAGWFTAAVACLAAFGIPALILALVWRFGGARRSLRAEEQELRDGGRSSRHVRLGSTSGVA